MFSEFLHELSLIDQLLLLFVPLAMHLFQFISQIRFHLKGSVELVLKLSSDCSCLTRFFFFFLLLSIILASFRLFFNFFLLWNRIFFRFFFRLSFLFRFIFLGWRIDFGSFLDFYGSRILCLFMRLFQGSSSRLGSFRFSRFSRIFLLSCSTFCLFL